MVFGAVGTAGQRCTTIRRLFVQRKIAAQFTERLVSAYKQVRIGDPLDERTVMGPLVKDGAELDMLDGLKEAGLQGGEVLTGGSRLEGPGYFVEPTIVHATSSMPVVKEEIFAPILYVMEYDTLEEAIAWHNDVPAGTLVGYLYLEPLRS